MYHFCPGHDSSIFSDDWIFNIMQWLDPLNALPFIGRILKALFEFQNVGYGFWLDVAAKLKGNICTNYQHSFRKQIGQASYNLIEKERPQKRCVLFLE